MNDLSLYERVPLLDNSFTVKMTSFDRSHNLLPHWHENIELLYFYKGKCRCTVNGRSFDVAAGDLVIVNSTEIHSFDTEERVKYQCVLIYPAFFADVDFPSVILKNRVRGDKFVAECIEKMNAERENCTDGSDMMIKSYAYALMAYLLRRYTEERLTPEKYDERGARKKKINEILEYVSGHYSEKITTARLAEMCFMSEEHFCRLFKRAVGKTVTGYLMEYRIEKASVLLKKTEESITAVADSVGFDDVNYFSRSFKRIKGATPSAYRRIKKGI